MALFFPCAICGTTLSTNTFNYQKHMTKCHWSSKNNTFPLPSIFTTPSSLSPSPVSAPYRCFFCDFGLANMNELASHLILSHGSDLHSILCPKALDQGLRDEVIEFLNKFAASGAAFVSLCYCFPGHPVHSTPATTNLLDWTENTETDETETDEIGNDSGLGSPMSTGSDGLADGKSDPPAFAEKSDLFALPGMSDLPSLDGDGNSTSPPSKSDPPSNLTPKTAEFLVSVGLTPTRTTSGKRVYLRPYMP